MNVLLTKNFMSSDIEYLKAGLTEGISLIEPDEYNESAVVEKIPDADVLLGGMLTELIVKASKHIKLIQIPWTGVDNIDFNLLKKYEVGDVCNSHSNGSVVAEHALALYFSVAKKIHYHDAQLRKGNWNRVSPGGNDVSPFSQSISGQNVVLIGYGAVNRAVHKFLNGFGSKISVVNRSGKVENSSTLSQVYSFDRIVNALDGANVVFIAVPLTQDTKRLFNFDCFQALGKEAILINVARGSVVEEEALFNALAKRQIYGAGIDTWYNYPKPGKGLATPPSSKFPFNELSNLVMSPHRAGYVDSGFPHLDDVITNINNLYQDKALINRLSVENHY